MQRAPSFKNLAALCLCALLLASCAMFSGRESAGEYVDDATITSKIKAAILSEPELRILQVNVETMQGVVQLSGFVDSPKSENKAVEIARHTEGVKSVKDNLVVR